MKNILYISLIFFLISCSTKPEPIVAGKDVCSYCKMPVADTRFGGEIITEKGKIYKFDDIGCMIHFLTEGINNEKAKQILSLNYLNNQELIDVYQSSFLISSELHTPMNSDAASFKTKKEAEEYIEKFPGKILSWDELIKIIK